MNENRATTSPPQSLESGDFDEDTDDDDFLEPDDDDDDVRISYLDEPIFVKTFRQYLLNLTTFKLFPGKLRERLDRFTKEVVGTADNKRKSQPAARSQP